MEQLGLQLAAMGGTLTGLWLLSAAGFAAAVLDRGLRAKWIWLIAFPVLSFAATCPGLLFRNHYFLFVLPAAGLLAGLALSTLAQRLSRAKKTNTAALLSGLLGAALLGIAVAGQWKILVSLPDAGVTRATFGLNPFPESIAIADYLRQATGPDDRIAVIGSEPQLYFYSNRRAATGYIYTYALMEDHPFALKMQREMIQEIEASRPKFMVLVKVPTSWLGRPNSHQEIIQWADRYVEAHYERTGAVQLRSPESLFLWNEKAAALPENRQGYWIEIFMLKKT